MADFEIRIKATDQATPATAQVEQSFKKMGDTIKTTLDEANTKGASVTGAIGSAFSMVGGVIGKVFSGLGSIVSGAFGVVVSIAEGAVELVKKAWELIPEAFQVIFDKVTLIVGVAMAFVIDKVAESAAATESAGNAFLALSDSVGQSSNKILQAMREGSAGTISDLNLMRIANEALIAGIIKTPAHFKALAQTAIEISQSRELDPAVVFQQLVEGIDKANERVLKGLGIVADFNLATHEYIEGQKKAHHIDVDRTKDLDERQKTLVLLAAAQKKLNEGKEFLSSSDQKLFGSGKEIMDAIKAHHDFSIVLTEEEQEAALAAASIDKHAKEVKDASVEVTEAQKAEIALIAVLKSADQIHLKLGDTVHGLTTKFGQLKTTIANTYESVTSIAGPALGMLSDRTKKVVERLKELIEKNHLFSTDVLEDWANRAIIGLDRLEVKLPKIIDSIENGLSQAFNLASTAADYVWIGITDGIAGARREFDIFSSAVSGFLAGNGFDASGSALIAVFDVIAASVKLLAFKAAEAFSESFGQAAIDIANQARQLKNTLIDARIIAQGAIDIVEHLTAAVPIPGFGMGIEEYRQAHQKNMSESVSLINQKNLSPITGPQLQSNLKKGETAAQGDLDAALARLAPIAKNIDDKGQVIRDKAADAVTGLADSVKDFFATDEERQQKVFDAARASANKILYTMEYQAGKTAEEIAKYNEINAKVQAIQRMLAAAYNNPAPPIVTGN